MPRGCLAELTVEVTCMGIGFEVACTIKCFWRCLQNAVHKQEEDRKTNEEAFGFLIREVSNTRKGRHYEKKKCEK